MLGRCDGGPDQLGCQGVAGGCQADEHGAGDGRVVSVEYADACAILEGEESCDAVMLDSCHA